MKLVWMSNKRPCATGCSINACNVFDTSGHSRKRNSRRMFLRKMSQQLCCRLNMASGTWAHVFWTTFEFGHRRSVACLWFYHFSDDGALPMEYSLHIIIIITMSYKLLYLITGYLRAKGECRLSTWAATSVCNVYSLKLRANRFTETKNSCTEHIVQHAQRSGCHCTGTHLFWWEFFFSRLNSQHKKYDMKRVSRTQPFSMCQQRVVQRE